LTEELFKVYDRPKGSLAEQLEREIADLQSKNMDSTERLRRITELKEKFSQLQEEQNSLRSKEDQELDQLTKKALELLIKRLQG
jgi:molecular chaperone GrpE (heat shock protein)